MHKREILPWNIASRKNIIFIHRVVAHKSYLCLKMFSVKEKISIFDDFNNIASTRSVIERTLVRISAYHAEFIKI